jgi:hypothetical protein
MNSDMRQLENLASRARRGEAEAATRLRQLLAPQMVYIVRRALRVGRGVSPLDRRILVEAEQARVDSVDSGQACQGEYLVRRVAQRICDNLVREGVERSSALTRCLTPDTVLA